MKQYLLSVYHPEDTPPPPDVDQIFKDVEALNDEIRAAGAWVFAGGLHPSTTATVVRVGASGDILTTDGPFVEGKEHIGGFWVIKAPDLDSALKWSHKATRACRVPIEVRPLQEEV
jgi:hypothetical protein